MKKVCELDHSILFPCFSFSPPVLEARLPHLAKRLNSGENKLRSISFELPPSNNSSPAISAPSRKSFVKSVRLPVPQEVLEAAHDLTGRDITVEPESALAKALTQAAMGRRISLHQSHPSRSQTPKYVCGREICQGHEQYALAYGMMLGLRVMVSLISLQEI